METSTFKSEIGLSIIMYHYVRDLKNSKYPEIKGLDIALFVEQLEYLAKHYQFISVHDLLVGNELPPNPVLLTFDDGYIDNHTFVFPELEKRGIKGAFFPIVDASQNGRVLDVNKIHFVLASVSNKEELVGEIDNYVITNKEALELNDVCEYKNNVPKSRFDTDDVVYIKCMLQRDLPLESRAYLTNKLFEKFVSADEADFASELYVTKAQLKEMYEKGQSVGIHGYSHSWLATLGEEEQTFEIDESIKFLKSIGVKEKELIIAYPYGNYNDITIDVCKKRNVRFGFTTQVGKADLRNSLELARVDTNDVPKERNARPKA